MTEHSPAKRVPGRLLGYAALGVCAAIALYYSLHSLHLAATLTRSMPYHDHWMWVVSDYFHYLDGRYSVWRLFAQVGESEHRLLTTKLVLFADAILFQMRGVFPTALMYFCLAGVAFMLARLAVQPVSWPAQIAAFIVLLAITWSLAQYRDLSWQYEVQFPLLHVFALAGLYAFAIALSTDDSNRYIWFAVAFLCDFLTAWSEAAESS